MVVSSALSIIMVKICKCVIRKKEAKDIAPISDLEMHKDKNDGKDKGQQDDLAGYATANRTEMT